MPARDGLQGVAPPELVLLRIWELDRGGRTEMELQSATREGLAGFFAVSSAQMSTDLRRLNQEGLVEKRVSLARGRMRRVGVFAPTAKGQKKASRLHQLLLDASVLVEGAERPLKDVLEGFPFRVSVAGAARFIRNGLFDREACLKLEMGRIAAITGRGLLPAPIEDFIGRERELGAIKEFLFRRRPDVLVLDGIPGIGKSSLAVRAISKWTKADTPFFYDLVAGGTARHLLESLAYYLLTRDRPLLERCLAALPDERLGEAVPVLRRELGALPSVLVFDDLQRASAETLELLGHLLALTATNHALKFVLVSRDGQGALQFARSHVPERTAQLTLGWLAEGEARALWRRVGGRTEFRDAWRAVGGHPQLLTLASSFEGELEPIVELAAEHLGRWLDEEEREALEAVAVFRHPVQVEALDEIGLRDHAALRRLIDRRFLAESKGGLVTIHDTLREAALTAISVARRTALDLGAARYWTRFGGPMGLEEAAFHLCRSGGEGALRDFLAEHGRMLASAGYASSLELLFERALPGGSSTPRVHEERIIDDAELLLARASFETARGRFVDAERLLGEVSEHPKAGEWASIRARIERANVLQRLGRKQDAVEVLRGISLPLDAPGYEEARLFHLVGSVYEALDELDKAEKFHRQCAAVPSSNARALGHLGVGRIMWRRGLYSAAAKEFRESADVACQSGEVEASLNAKLFLSTVIAKMAETDKTLMAESIKILEDVGRIAESHGLLRQLGYSENNLADNYCWLELFEMASRHLEKAMQIAFEIGEGQIQNQCKSTKALILLGQGKHADARSLLDEVLKFAEGQFPADFRLRQMMLATYLFEETEDLDRARRMAEEGLRLARDSQEPEHVKHFEVRLSSISG